MEKTKENDIPNLIDSEGNALVDIESKKRAEILGDIKEKRKQRDTLLKQSSSFKTKINDFLGKEKVYHYVHAQRRFRKTFTRISIGNIRYWIENLNKKQKVF
jgi:hypothetical protein